MTDNTQADSGQQARSKHKAERQTEVKERLKQNAEIRAAEITCGDYALPQFRSLNDKATAGIL